MKIPDKYSIDIEKIREGVGGVLSSRRTQLLVALALIVLFVFRSDPAGYLAVLLVVLTPAVAFTAKLMGLNSFGIETATFSTVVLGFIFGPEAGAFMGLVLITLQLVTGSPGVYVLWVVPGYVAAGAIAGTVGWPLETLGIATAVGLQLFFMLCTVVLTPHQIARYMPYAVFNIVFNYLLFEGLSGKVLSLAA